MNYIANRAKIMNKQADSLSKATIGELMLLQLSTWQHVVVNRVVLVGVHAELHL